MNLQEVVEENYRLVGTLVPPQHSVLLQSRISSRSIHRLTQGISSVTWTYKCRLSPRPPSKPFPASLRSWTFPSATANPLSPIAVSRKPTPRTRFDETSLGEFWAKNRALGRPTSPSTSSCSPACSPSHTGWMTQKLCDSLEKYTPVLLRMSGLVHQGAFALPCSSPTTTT